MTQLNLNDRRVRAKLADENNEFPLNFYWCSCDDYHQGPRGWRRNITVEEEMQRLGISREDAAENVHAYQHGWPPVFTNLSNP